MLRPGDAHPHPRTHPHPHPPTLTLDFHSSPSALTLSRRHIGGKLKADTKPRYLEYGQTNPLYKKLSKVFNTKIFKDMAAKIDKFELDSMKVRRAACRRCRHLSTLHEPKPSCLPAERVIQVHRRAQASDG